MNWFYVDGPRRVGPLSDSEWADLVRSGKIQPGTLVWHEGLPTWTPHAQVPPPPPAEPEGGIPAQQPDSEPVHGDDDSAADAGEETPAAWTQRILTQDFKVSIRSCLARAWDLFRAHFWMLVGSTFLTTAVMMICLWFPGLDLLMQMALQGVLFAGLFNVYLRLMRGEPVVTADLLAGFDGRIFRQLILKTLVTFLLSSACFLPTVLVSMNTGLTMENMESKIATDPGSVMLFLIVLLSFIWMFATPLILDKGLTFWQAMNLSRRKVMRHPWKVSLLAIVAGIIGVVGLIFTAPLYIAATLYLYEDIFTQPPPGDEGKPPAVES